MVTMQSEEYTPAPSLALGGIESLLGIGVVKDDLWRDLSLFEATALPLITAQWQLDAIDFTQPSTEHFLYRCYYQRDEEVQAAHTQHITATVQALLHALGGAAVLARCAATFYLHPQLWAPHYYEFHLGSLKGCQAHLLHEVAGVCLQQDSPPDWIARLCRRIVTLCLVATSASYEVDVAHCIGYLLAQNNGAAAPLLDALAVSDWQRAWNEAVRLAGYAQAITASPGAVERLKEYWQGNGTPYTLVLLGRYFNRKELDSVVFRHVIASLPDSLNSINAALVTEPFATGLAIESLRAYRVPYIHAVATAQQIQDTLIQTDWTAFRDLLQQLTDAVLCDMMSTFLPEHWSELCGVACLSGGQYLLRLAEEVERRRLQRLSMSQDGRDLHAVLVHLLGVLRQPSDEDSAHLVQSLQKLSERTLLALLPHVSAYESEICAALGWTGSTGLLNLLKRLQQQQPAYSTDPQAGVLHCQEVRAFVGPVNEVHMRMLLDRLKFKFPDAVWLMQAALDWNRKEIRRSLARRNQLAVRALGLLPLEQPDELLERYLMIAKYVREAQASGAGRKAYEHAAAQAALTNLAYQSGFADATRLEWAMESRLGTERTNIGRQWQIAGYTLTLVLRNGTPAIEVHNNKRVLKRLPRAVTRDYNYRKEVSGVLRQAHNQIARYRQAFLDAMRQGQHLTADEVALLRGNPLASALLARLVLIDEAGVCGLFRAEDGSLESLHGECVPIQGAVVIAHPYTLEEAGVLVDWQAELVRRQLVQPFKQVFREVYMITSTEVNAMYESVRLAGRRLKGRQALAILANMGWVIDGSKTVHKPFFDLGYAAQVEIGELHTSYGNDGAIMGRLSFRSLRATLQDGKCEQRVSLSMVPPLVFSEVLRDLDLVTVAAHNSDEQGTSREVLRRRGDIAYATAAALGLEHRITVEESVVRVRGSLANYRVHLATAAVYAETGQAICMLSDSEMHTPSYGALDEDGESVGSEVISKMLRLVYDREIKDEAILSQILRHRQHAA